MQRLASRERFSAHPPKLHFHATLLSASQAWPFLDVSLYLPVPHALDMENNRVRHSAPTVSGRSCKTVSGLHNKWCGPQIRPARGSQCVGLDVSLTARWLLERRAGRLSSDPLLAWQVVRLARAGQWTRAALNSCQDRSGAADLWTSIDRRERNPLS